jgi:hypothetical protein
VWGCAKGAKHRTNGVFIAGNEGFEEQRGNANNFCVYKDLDTKSPVVSVASFGCAQDDVCGQQSVLKNKPNCPNVIRAH